MNYITTTFHKNLSIEKGSDQNGSPYLLNEPCLTEIGQTLYVLLNPLQRNQRVQEREMKNLSTASWKGVEAVQHKLTSQTETVASKIITVSANKPSFFKKKVTPTKRQSNEEYVRHLEIETLSTVLQLEPRLGRAPTMADLLAYFSKLELDLVWNSILMYYPDIYSNLPNLPRDEEEEENIYSTKLPKEEVAA